MLPIIAAARWGLQVIDPNCWRRYHESQNCLRYPGVPRRRFAYISETLSPPAEGLLSLIQPRDGRRQARSARPFLVAAGDAQAARFASGRR